MKTKLEMAHDYAVAMLRTPAQLTGMSDKDIAIAAFNLADAMQAEADKRLLEAEYKEEWQPDWIQAPEWAGWWAMDKSGQGIWHKLKPRRDQSVTEWVIDFSSGSDFSYKVSPDFNYTGDWRESLRKRPN